MSGRIFKTVRNAWDTHPHAGQFLKDRFSPNMLMVQVTNRCTNRCRYCTNRSSPQDTRQMALPVLKRIISEASSSPGLFAHLWGGETFLYPHLTEAIDHIHANEMGLTISSNGSFGTSVDVAERELNALIDPVPIHEHVTVYISCDHEHQSQKATPRRKIANIITAARRINDDRLHIMINTVSLPNDGSAEIVKEVIGPDATLDPEALYEGTLKVVYPDSKTNIAWFQSPVQTSFGRAKDLELTTPILAPNTDPAWIFGPMETGLHVGVEGQVYLADPFVGDGIFPIGNIHTHSIPQIVADANRSLMTRVVAGGTMQDLLFAYRKYVDTQRLAAPCTSHYALFRRLWELDVAEFDKTPELNEARTVIANPLASQGPELDWAFDTVRQYGDLTDTPALQAVYQSAALAPDTRWQAALAYLLLIPKDPIKTRFGGFSIHVKGGATNIVATGPKVQGLGSQPMPPWILEGIRFSVLRV